MRALQKLTECKQLLELHHELLSKAIGTEDQSYNPPEIAMTRAFEFGKRSLDAMEMLLHKPELAIFALALCRPFHELSKRLLWASREKYGWYRLVAYYAADERKTAATLGKLPIDKFPKTVPHVQEILDEKKEVLSRKDPKGQPFKPAPSSLEEILRQIEKRDIRDGWIEEANVIRSEEYNTVYRMMCRVTHAHIVAIGDEVPPDAHLKSSVVAVAIATLALIRAGYFYRGGNDKSEMETARNQIRDIVHACRNLSFDDSEN